MYTSKNSCDQIENWTNKSRLSVLFGSIFSHLLLYNETIWKTCVVANRKHKTCLKHHSVNSDIQQFTIECSWDVRLPSNDNFLYTQSCPSSCVSAVERSKPSGTSRRGLCPPPAPRFLSRPLLKALTRPSWPTCCEMSRDLRASEVIPLVSIECPCEAIISDCVIILDIIRDVIWSSITLRDVSIT